MTLFERKLKFATKNDRVRERERETERERERKKAKKRTKERKRERASSMPNDVGNKPPQVEFSHRFCL